MCMLSDVHITSSWDTIVLDTVMLGTFCWVASGVFRPICNELVVWVANYVDVDV